MSRRGNTSPRSGGSPRWIRRARAARGGQSGVTLVEVLVGIVVMAPLTLASVSGLLLQMKVSTGTQDAQRLEVSLTEAGEDVMAVPYVSCGDPSQYQELLDGWGAALDPELVSTSQVPGARVVAVEYWSSAKGVFLSECGSDDGAQRVSLVTVDADRSARGAVVKRNPVTRAAGTG